LKHPIDGKYYLVPKKDILYSGIIVVDARFDNAVPVTAKHIATFACNLTQDSALTNMYENPITDKQYDQILKNYEYYKNDLF